MSNAVVRRVMSQNAGRFHVARYADTLSGVDLCDRPSWHFPSGIVVSGPFGPRSGLLGLGLSDRRICGHALERELQHPAGSRERSRQRSVVHLLRPDLEWCTPVSRARRIGWRRDGGRGGVAGGHPDSGAHAMGQRACRAVLADHHGLCGDDRDRAAAGASQDQRWQQGGEDAGPDGPAASWRDLSVADPDHDIVHQCCAGRRRRVLSVICDC